MARLFTRKEVDRMIEAAVAKAIAPLQERIAALEAELAKAKKSAIVMHPLPRLDEIGADVDNTSHAKYFQQVWYGLVLRMSLLGLVLGAV